MLARFAVNNPVVANIIMVAIFVLGIISFLALPRQLMSDVSFNWVFIITPYSGVSPEEIERLVTVPIENEIQDVKGIKSISSQSNEGVSFVSVRFDDMPKDEYRARLQDLRTEVDKVADLPEDALDTIVQSFTTSDMMPVISVHLHGKVSQERLTPLAKELKEKLLNISRISKVELSGDLEPQVWVEADPLKLEGYFLSPERIQTAIAAHGVNIPGGTISLGQKELILRTVGEFENTKQIEDVIVYSSPSGQMLRVRDVAKVRQSFKKEQTLSQLNREPVVSMAISKQTDGNSIQITDEVKRICQEFEKKYGDAISISFTQDSSEQISEIMSKLSRNALAGFIVVVAMLMIVLGFRNAVLAAMGIPISFLACFIFMYNSGNSFNGNSLFGLVLVLGIIVDDAIIIVENCYRHLQNGKSWHDAAIEGTQEVMGPVLSATATTISAFLPLMLLPGIMGQFMRVIPLVVCLALVASMVEAFIILPAHFADWPGRKAGIKRAEPQWLLHIQHYYVRILTFIVNRRKRFALFPLLLIILVGVGIFRVEKDLFSGEEIATFQIRMKMPIGTNLETSSKILKQFEEKCLELPSEEVRAIHTTAGRIITDSDWVLKSNVGEIWLDLVPSYNRNRSTDDIMTDLRRRISKIPGPINVELAKINTGPPGGKPVEVMVKGKKFDELLEVAGRLEAMLKEKNGVIEVGNNYEEGKREIRFKVDHRRAALHNLSVAQVGMAVRNSIEGVIADKMYDEDEEIDIVVRVDKSAFKSPGDFMKLPLLTPTGDVISLSHVADQEVVTGYGEIRRYDRQRAITVFASIKEGLGTDPVKVNGDIKEFYQGIEKEYPGVSLDFGGEFREFQDSLSGISQLFAFGMLLVFAILAAQFKSYIQPMVILLTIPLAFIGAACGLLISGNPLSIIVLFGAVALAGIAVNDAIVMISFTNNLKQEGMSSLDAVIEAGRMRLRPIMLTSITTIAGLVPMAIGLGGMSLTWGPLANIIVWGLAVGTLLMIFLIPAAYMIVVEDIGRSERRAIAREEKSQRVNS